MSNKYEHYGLSSKILEQVRVWRIQGWTLNKISQELAKLGLTYKGLPLCTSTLSAALLHRYPEARKNHFAKRRSKGQPERSSMVSKTDLAKTILNLNLPEDQKIQILTGVLR